MITEAQQEIIDKYLKGKLTAKEEEEFVKYQRITEFQEELEFQSNLKKAIWLNHREAFQKKIEELKQISIETHFTPSQDSTLEKKIKTNEKSDRKVKVISWHKLNLIAASIALAILAGIYFWQIGGAYSVTIEHVALAGPSKGEDTEDVAALEAYDQREYSTAKQLFNAIPDDKKSDQELFYNAITLLLLYQHDANLADIEQAIQYLTKLSNDSGNYKEMAEWYLALAYILNEEEDKAKAVLEEITQKSHPYSEEAQKQLRQL